MSQVNFFQFPFEVRLIVANCLYSYEKAHQRTKVKHELIATLAQEQWQQVKLVFTERLKGDLPSFKAMEANCNQALMSKSKGAPCFIGPQFRLASLPFYTPTFPELICCIQAAFPKAKSEDHEVIPNLLKLVMILTKDMAGIDRNRVESLMRLNLLHTMFAIQHRSDKQVKAKMAQQVIEYRRFTSIIFRLVEFFEIVAQFVKRCRYHQTTGEMCESSEDLAKAQQIILTTQDVEERAFCFQWIVFRPAKTPNEKRVFSTKLNEEYLEHFKTKYLVHKNPNIRLLASVCLVNYEVHNYRKTTVQMFALFAERFYAFYALNLQAKLAPYFEPNLINLPEFTAFIAFLTETFSFLNLPKTADSIYKFSLKDSARAIRENPLPLAKLDEIEAKLKQLEKFLPSLHFLYNLSYNTLCQTHETQAANQKVKALDHLQEHYGTAMPASITLPHPANLSAYSKAAATMQFEFAEDLATNPTVEAEDYQSDEEDEMPLPIAAASPTFRQVLTIRDFPLHRFSYDERVTSWFTKLEGDWTLAPWHVQCHAFPSFIDLFVGTIYSKKTNWINKTTGHRDLQYLLCADIILKDKSFNVTIQYTKGGKLWYHRYMRRNQDAVWDEVRSTELQESAAQGKSIPQQLGNMTFESASETVLIDFKTFSMRLHPLRPIVERQFDFAHYVKV